MEIVSCDLTTTEVDICGCHIHKAGIQVKRYLKKMLLYWFNATFSYQLTKLSYKGERLSLSLERKLCYFQGLMAEQDSGMKDKCAYL